MKKWLIAAALIAAVGLTGCLLTFRSSGVFDRKAWQSEKTVAVAGITEVSIDAQAADVEVAPHAGGHIIVTANGSGNGYDPQGVTVTRSGSRLSISEHEPVDSLRVGFFSYMHVTVQLPARAYRLLAVHTNAGNLSLRGIHGIGQLRAGSNAGNVRASSFSARSAAFSSNAGGISLSDFTGGVTADADAGNIDMRTRQLSGDVRAKSNAGDVAIHFTDVPESVAVDYGSEIGSGNIHIPGLTYLSKTQGMFRAVKGGGKYKIRVRTNAGNLTID
ncbi:MAG: DUF4097 family beta strand repeat-containing protein [Sporolactobacillus sp.]